MWQQFRVQYPTGSLTAELITLHDGLFVVRAIARVDETILASGLAAAMTVEEAEDRARTRALLMLGLLPDAPTSTSSPSLASGTFAAPAIAPDSLEDVGEPKLSSEVPPEEFPAPGSIAKDEPESAGWTGEEGGSTMASERLDRLPDLSTPTDDSDLMMKTTVEIRRLRWTIEQGRHHLEATYSKRSRQHLTREELLDFLLYLETQPTP